LGKKLLEIPGRQRLKMTELEQVLTGDAAAAAPSRILEGLSDDLVHRVPAGAPHSIYEELWHITFWQQVTLDWINAIETPFPASPRDGFPTVLDAEREYWQQLCKRFFTDNALAAAAARDRTRLDQPIRCPSRPGEPLRVMTVREQLENLGAHNAYHFGRIVLLRQILGVWPPASGGYAW
jgi:uncharacterized damage-inducible protein DinB